MFCTKVLQATIMSRTEVVIIYLQTQDESVLLLVQFLRESAPTIIWVSRSWGLPVPPFPFLERLRHCGTFIGTHTISEWT